MAEVTLHSPEQELVAERRPYRIVLQKMGAALLGACMWAIASPAYAKPIADDTPSAGYEYVALGDSYASGEGNPPFVAGTDIQGVNECHRSEAAYPYLVAKELGAHLVHVACSRMAPAGLFYDQWNEGEPQLDHLNERTRLVTITIGGNQIDLAGTLKTCFVSTCGPDTPIYQENMATFAGDDFRNLLEKIDREILKRAPNAQKVLVVGYPKVIEGHPLCTIMGYTDDDAIADMVDALNDASRETVDAIDDPRLKFVYPPGNIDLCSLSGKFNLLPVFGHPEYLAHPNEAGQAAMAETVLRTLEPPVD